MRRCHSFRIATARGALSTVLAGCFSLAGGRGLCGPDYTQIIGDWKSSYGPVHLHFVSAESPSGSATLSGYWIEPPDDHKGEIKEGHYNASSGELNLSFVETWSKHQGDARLMLDDSGKAFSGSWKMDDGTSGTWTWKRK